jgi:hypothetical protein
VIWARSRNRRFKGSYGHVYTFSASLSAKNATLARLIKRCFSALLDLRTHFVHTGRPEMQIWRCLKSDHSMGIPALRPHFLHSDPPKIRLSQGRESDVSKCLSALRTQSLLLSGPKCDFWELEKLLFQGVTWHCELILCLLAGKKCD